MLEKFEAVVREACTKNGVGLYDIEVVKTQNGNLLCVYITKINGVNITDCTNVSKELNAFLDLNPDIIKGAFTLEVSSPGIERPLKLKKHYMGAMNEWVNLKLGIKSEVAQNSSQASIDSTASSQSVETTAMSITEKKTITGVLREVNQDFITIEVDSEMLHIPFNIIKKAKTIYKTKKESQ